MKTIGLILKEECQKQDVSGNRLAIMTGLTQSWVSRVLRGRCDLSMEALLRILAALDKDLMWLHNQGVVPVKCDEKFQTRKKTAPPLVGG